MLTKNSTSVEYAKLWICTYLLFNNMILFWDFIQKLLSRSL